MPLDLVGGSEVSGLRCVHPLSIIFGATFQKSCGDGLMHGRRDRLFSVLVVIDGPLQGKARQYNVNSLTHTLCFFLYYDNNIRSGFVGKPETRKCSRESENVLERAFLFVLSKACRFSCNVKPSHGVACSCKLEENYIYSSMRQRTVIICLNGLVV